jgi:oligosaccharyltransferase complex subunit gamma
MIGGLLYLKRNNLQFLYNKTSWSIFVIGLVLIFISGQMWNQIRGPPMFHRNHQTGQIVSNLSANNALLSYSFLAIF